MLEWPIVDTHVHVWWPEQFPRPWLDALPALDRPFGLAEYHDQTRGLPIDGMVLVETGVAPYYALLEAQWAASVAGADPCLQGVVAAAPLDDGRRLPAFLAPFPAPRPRLTTSRAKPHLPTPPPHRPPPASRP